MTEKILNEAEQRLIILLAEIKGTPIGERTEQWIARFCPGRPLFDYLHDAHCPVKERAQVAEHLVEILINKDYSRLPLLSAEELMPIPPAPESPAVELSPEVEAAIDRRVQAQLSKLLATMARALAR